MTAPRFLILIVDDEERIRSLFLEYVEDFEEFHASGVTSGEEGLQHLGEAPADLCLVDMRLPGMDGEAFILAAARAGLCRRFILHTGSVDLSLSQNLRGLGLTDNDLFIKPADMAVLLSRIREVLGSGEG